jgi:hypothetical protein
VPELPSTQRVAARPVLSVTDAEGLTLPPRGDAPGYRGMAYWIAVAVAHGDDERVDDCHAPVGVLLVPREDAHTVWRAGDSDGRYGVYNGDMCAGVCRGGDDSL